MSRCFHDSAAGVYEVLALSPSLSSLSIIVVVYILFSIIQVIMFSPIIVDSFIVPDMIIYVKMMVAFNKMK